MHSRDQQLLKAQQEVLTASFQKFSEDVTEHLASQTVSYEDLKRKVKVVEEELNSSNRKAYDYNVTLSNLVKDYTNFKININPSSRSMAEDSIQSSIESKFSRMDEVCRAQTNEAGSKWTVITREKIVSRT